jgi:hypothetical protein
MTNYNSISHSPLPEHQARGHIPDRANSFAARKRNRQFNYLRIQEGYMYLSASIAATTSLRGWI